MKPSSKPKATRAQILERAYMSWNKHHPNSPLPDVFLVGIRGFYLDTMGKAGVNDRGIYDDAIFVFGQGETFASFNANTDPSSFRQGVATLMQGWHPYKLGNHGISRPGGGYPALRPSTKNEELPVMRDGDSSIPSKRPGVAINIHKGSFRSTSSEGCQTIHPSQWQEFYAMVSGQMKRASMKQIWYCLLGR
jgi:lysozyme